jgi:transposase-like protein
MNDPTCPDCASSDVGTEQTPVRNGVAEDYSCNDCDATWPIGIWRDGRLR